MDGGGFTWTDEHPDGAPGWWRLPEGPIWDGLNNE
jgi:hypothetical protein